jgi:prepilin-type N-terminal cleavage/methylation domain-containing protein
MKLFARFVHSTENGFSVVEVLVAAVIFGIITLGLFSALNTSRTLYSQARQLNEMYTVLSACPEIDRALDFTALSGSNNCYPNNSFPAEDGSGGTITYTPTLSVTNTTALANTDPLYNIPDSKVIDISVGWQRPFTGFPAMELRMLITRNGVGQT